MQIGWGKLYSYLNRKPGQYSAVGLEYSQNGLHLCAFKKVDGQHVWTLNQTFPLENWQSELQEFVQVNELANSHTALVFSLNKYQLVQTDRPQVPDEELAQALTWSIKDLIMTQDEVVADYFDLPAQTTGANKVNVVAVPKEELFIACQGVMEAGLYLENVSVNELATCDLVPESPDAYLTVMQEPGAEICVNIIKDRNLYFSRRIRGYESIKTFTEEELKMGIADNLSVELQRSMDFFEGQLKQAPVKKILLNLDSQHLQTLCELIKGAMLVDTEAFSPTIEKEIHLDVSEGSFAALGGAMSLIQKDQATPDGQEDSVEATGEVA